MYPGSDLVKGAGGGIIAVVIQYRLGLFGIVSQIYISKIFSILNNYFRISRRE